MVGEDDFVRRLLAELPRSKRVLVGPGDDAAVVAGSANPWVVTTDLSVEGIDFLAGEDPEAIGRRAMAANLSDLAAMGARPELFLLSIGFPAARGEAYPLAIARGALSRATPLQVDLAGGDVSDADLTVVSIALWGEPEREPILRSGARPGDLLFLSGYPGRAAAGLLLSRARAEGSPRATGLSESAEAELLSAYRDPEPRVALGLALAREGLATSAIDVSDGVGIDAARLAAASGARAVIEPERVPISAALAELAHREGLDALEMALAGGDDYELLFTVSPERAHGLPAGGAVPLRRIGQIESGRGAVLRSAWGERDIAALGHDHFAGR